MKFLFLSLLFLASCSSARYYQGPAVSQELRKNVTSLELVAKTVEADFVQKEIIIQRLERVKDQFIKENLDQKFGEMKEKREAVFRKIVTILNLNDGLLGKVAKKSKIKEGDPTFKAIENFADVKDRELTVLMQEFTNYKKASLEFEKLAFFSKMVKN